jgi:hypothetical protein
MIVTAGNFPAGTSEPFFPDDLNRQCIPQNISYAKNMVMHMSGSPPLLLIALILIAGCLTPVPKEMPAMTPAMGSIEVSSTPLGAEVYLDNVYRGTAPVTIIDAAGSHVLELRLRDYQSWSKAIVIEGGSRTYVDAALAPGMVVTTVLTAVPTTRPTTRPTTPVPDTPAGCWMHEIVQADFTVLYTYELDAGGTGRLSCRGVDKCLPPQELTWSQVPDPLDPGHSALVAIRIPDRMNPADFDERVLTYDARADILAYGESDNHVLFLKRTTCPGNGITIGAG